MKIVIVKWVDSCSCIGIWKDKNKIQKKYKKCKSAGFLVYEDEKIIIVSSSIDDCNNVAGDMTIPKCSITKIKKLGKI